MNVSRRAILAYLGAATMMLRAPRPARAQQKVRLGVLRLASSGPVFIAYERGYLRDQGLDVELKFFDAAQPIAVAVASGDVEFGVTAFTGGLFNLAGKGALKILAGQSREAPGYPLVAYLAGKAAFAAGLKSPQDLVGHSIGITQVGSSFHYCVGLLARKYGLDLLSEILIGPGYLPPLMIMKEGSQLAERPRRLAPVSDPIADPQSEPVNNPGPPPPPPSSGTPWTFWLTDTPCSSSTRQSLTGDHLLHSTDGNCSTSRLPKLEPVPTFPMLKMDSRSPSTLNAAMALRPGDVIVTPATGAYGHAMANNYNGAPRPPVIFARDGDAREVVRRESFEDLTARDVG